MDINSIIILVAAIAVIVIDAIFAVLIFKKKTASGEVTAPENYLELILNKVQDIAVDALKVASIKREDFETQEEYHLALINIVEENLIENAQEYGIDTKLLETLTQDDIDNFVYKVIEGLVSKANDPKTLTDNAILTESEATADSSLTDAINNFYSE